MAKIKIKFNNKEFQLDDATLAPATAELKSHFSTVMNGEGAVINLGGTAYNVDSTKLSTATNSFITHLGTITGNGSKVTIGGIEYGIDSSKVAGAVAEMEGALSNLGGSTETDKAAVLDEATLDYVILA